MAALTSADKIAIAKKFYEEFFQFKGGASTPWTKPELNAAADSINNWMDAAQLNFLAALATDAPAFSAASSGPQKTILFCVVALKRAGVI